MTELSGVELPTYFAPQAFDMAYRAGVVAVHCNLEQLQEASDIARYARGQALPDPTEAMTLVFRRAKPGLVLGWKPDPPFDETRDEDTYHPAWALNTEQPYVVAKGEIEDTAGTDYIREVDIWRFDRPPIVPLANMLMYRPAEAQKFLANGEEWGRLTGEVFPPARGKKIRKERQQAYRTILARCAGAITLSYSSYR